MPKQLQLKISKPCQEGWDKMDDTEKGKFCNSCQKQVIDFTTMGDHQLAAFFKKPATGHVCGRLMPDQLNRSIAIPKKRIPWVRYFFQITLPAFLMSLKASGQIKNQDTLTTYSKSGPARKSLDKTVNNFGRVRTSFPFVTDAYPALELTESGKASLTKTIAGIVTDQNGEPIPFASISMDKSLRKQVMADAIGNFSITRDWLRNSDKLVVSSAGFDTLVLNAGEIANRDSLHLQLRISKGTELWEAIVGGIELIPIEKSYYYDNNINRQTHPRLRDSDAKIKIFSNPIQAYSAIDIGIADLKPGKYTLQIADIPGQIVLQKEIRIAYDERSLTIPIPSIAAGNYFLSLTNNRTKTKISESIIVH